jgi:alpha-beta hydrolase superfamily lysophospholipase
MEAIANDISIIHDILPVGGIRLHRVSATPENPWARVAFLPGYGDHAMRYLDFFKWIAARGVALSAIDFRGHGVSTGARTFVNQWEEYLDDLAALLRASFKSSAPCDFVIAHSHGALVAAAAALRGQLPCRGCVFTAPFFRLKIPLSRTIRLVAQISSHAAPAWRFKSHVDAEILTRDEQLAEETRRDPLCLGIATPRWFVTVSPVMREVMRRAEEFSLPLLTMIPSADRIADPAAGEEFFRRAGSMDKTLKIYPEYRHELLRELGREQIYEEIHQWMRARATR